MGYNAKSLRVLGIGQLIIGIMMLLFGVISIAVVPYWSSYIACGIWVGIWVGLTGMFGYIGARSDSNPNKCLIGTMIGFAVTACVLAGIMFIIYAIALAEFAKRLRCGKEVYPTRYYNYRYNHYHDGCYDYYTYYRRYPTYNQAQAGAGIGSLLLILAVVEFFVALASSIYGCSSCCCTGPQSSQVHQQVTYLQQPGGNVVFLSPSGVVTPGTTVQTISTYPGQGVPVIQPQQGYAVSPQGIPQQGYPVQANQSNPANVQGAGGSAVATQQPQQAVQPPENKSQGGPPPYNFTGK